MADGAEDTSGGFVGRNPRKPTHPLLAAPTGDGEAISFRVPISPIAGWRLNDGRFDFNSSFVRAEAKREFGLLAPFAAETPKARPAIFAHADPVGQDEDNKLLTGRRARAVYAVLVRDASIWEDLFKNPIHGDTWGKPQLDSMLEALGFTGPTRVADFQKADGTLEPDGDLGTGTRKQLFPAYMDFLCADDSGTPFKYAPEDFLFRGKGKGLVGDIQGCSEFNPVTLLSEGETKSLPAAKRNEENARNRRVVLYLFPPGIDLDASRWPCPGVAEGTAKCRKRFWSDGEARRKPGADRRTYPDNRDTFACRFYERLAFNSPAENTIAGIGVGVARFRMLDEVTKDPLQGVTLTIRHPDGTERDHITDSRGEVSLPGVPGEKFDLVQAKQQDQLVAVNDPQPKNEATV